MNARPDVHWQPIAAMPDDRKDGRRILLWAEHGPQVGWWRTGKWLCTRLGAPLLDVSHWADIQDP